MKGTQQFHSIFSWIEQDLNSLSWKVLVFCCLFLWSPNSSYHLLCHKFQINFFLSFIIYSYSSLTSYAPFEFLYLWTINWTNIGKNKAVAYNILQLKPKSPFHDLVENLMTDPSKVSEFVPPGQGRSGRRQRRPRHVSGNTNTFKVCFDFLRLNRKM